MTTKDVYLAARRAYRASLRVNLAERNALATRNAALWTLRTVTGKWDDTMPDPWAGAKWAHGGRVCRWQVNLACTWWIRSH